MRPITVNAFKGANLSLDELLLPEGVGVDSQNQRPGHSDMRPWYLPSTVATVPSGTQRQTIYRLGQDVASDANYWLQWTTIVHAIRGFDNPDTTERTYFTGSGTAKWTDNVIGLSGGAPYPQATRELSVPAPTTAIIAAQAAAGTGTDEIDYWIYTWVNDLGWESAPSPVSNALTIKPGATINLSNFDTVPGGNYGITTVRLYKTGTGTSGSTSFFFFRQWAVGSTPGNPIDDARARGTDTVPSIGWIPPPSDASSITKLWNGMVAIITGKAVRISEPYKPYAYPIKYEIATPDNPVGLAVWGQSFLILTNGDPYLVQGSTPSALDAQPTLIKQPCSSVRGIVEFAEGIAWPSPNGYWWYGQGGPRNLLDGVLDREQWQALVPSTIVASRYLGYLVAFYNDGGGLKGFVLDPANPEGIYWLSTGYNAVHRDPLQDKLYVLAGTNIQLWNVVASGKMTASFTSKRMRMEGPFNVGALEVIAKTYPVSVQLYADGALWCTLSVPDDTPVRPPSGKEAQSWQVKVTLAGTLTAVRLAASVDDLKNTVTSYGQVLEAGQ